MSYKDKGHLNFIEISSKAESHRVTTLIANGNIEVADVERKTWWGGWKKVGSLLTYMDAAKEKIKKCEVELKNAKASHEQAIADVRAVLAIYAKSGHLYGRVEETPDKKPPKTSTEIIEKVSPSSEKKASTPEKKLEFIMAAPAPGGGNNNGNQKGGSNNNSNGKS